MTETLWHVEEVTCGMCRALVGADRCSRPDAPRTPTISTGARASRFVRRCCSSSAAVRTASTSAAPTASRHRTGAGCARRSPGCSRAGPIASSAAIGRSRSPRAPTSAAPGSTTCSTIPRGPSWARCLPRGSATTRASMGPPWPCAVRRSNTGRPRARPARCLSGVPERRERDDPRGASTARRPLRREHRAGRGHSRAAGRPRRRRAPARATSPTAPRAGIARTTRSRRPASLRPAELDPRLISTIRASHTAAPSSAARSAPCCPRAPARRVRRRHRVQRR